MPEVTPNRPSQRVLDSLTYDLPAKYDPINTASRAALKLAYSFDPADIAKLDLGTSGWSPFSAAQMEAVRDALAEYETVINVRFIETSGGDVDLALGRADIANDGFGGFSWRASGSDFDLDGYAIFDRSEPLTDGYGPHLLLHEIGHAMTLKHPGDYGGDEGPFLGKDKENNKYSVMSYKDNPDGGGTAGHLMLYDIAALQGRFGANLGYRTGDDIYTAPDGGLAVIWDAGGTDTIDGGSLVSALRIDLRDGRFSSLGARDNAAIAYGAVIENARGGSGNDTLVGNKWGNLLEGGGGSDSFVFVTKPGKSRDAIADFTPGVDTIALGADAFKGIGGKGALASARFHIGAAAADKDDRIIYDADTGLLTHDRNGSSAGKAKVFAALDPGLDLDTGDIIVI